MASENKDIFILMLSVAWKFRMSLVGKFWIGVIHEVVCHQEVAVGFWAELQPKDGLNRAGRPISKVATYNSWHVGVSPRRPLPIAWWLASP